MLYSLLWNQYPYTIWIQRKYVPLDCTTINDVLGVFNPSNGTFEIKIWESYLKQVAYYLALKGNTYEVKWSNQRGTKIIDFLAEAKILLQLVFWMIDPLRNIMDVVFHRDMMLACIMLGDKMYLQVQIMDEWFYFYDSERATTDLFLPSLIIAL